MDDHIGRYHDGKWRYPKALRAAIGKHFREASALFVISSVMGEFYQREFGVRAQVLFGPDALRTSGPLTIGYFGSVGPWQLDALLRFAATLPPDEARGWRCSQMPMLCLRRFDSLPWNSKLVSQRKQYKKR